MQQVNHAGYQRYIIQQNPLRYDEDGDLIDDEMEEDGDYDSLTDDNPWGGTRLEGALNHAQ